MHILLHSLDWLKKKKKSLGPSESQEVVGL